MKMKFLFLAGAAILASSLTLGPPEKVQAVTLSSAKLQLNKAKETTKQAEENKNKYSDEYNQAVDAVNNAQKNYDRAAKENDAKNDLDQKSTELTDLYNAQKAANTKSIEASQRVSQENADLTSANYALTQAKKDYDSATDAIKPYQDKVNEAQSAYDKLASEHAFQFQLSANYIRDLKNLSVYLSAHPNSSDQTAQDLRSKVASDGQSFLNNMPVQAIIDANLNNWVINYPDNDQDKKEVIKYPGILTYEQADELTTFAIRLINDARQQYGSAQLQHTDDGVTQAMWAIEYAYDYLRFKVWEEKVGGTILYNGHNNGGLEEYRQANQLAKLTENTALGGLSVQVRNGKNRLINRSSGQTTMNDLKKWTYEALVRMLFTPTESNFGDAINLLTGAPSGYNQVMGVQFDHYGFLHMIFIDAQPLTAQNKKYLTLGTVEDGSLNLNYDAENQALAKAKINLDAAKNIIAPFQAKLDAAKNKLDDSQKAVQNAQNDLANANDSQKQAQANAQDLNRKVQTAEAAKTQAEANYQAVKTNTGNSTEQVASLKKAISNAEQKRDAVKQNLDKSTAAYQAQAAKLHKAEQVVKKLNKDTSTLKSLVKNSTKFKKKKAYKRASRKLKKAYLNEVKRIKKLLKKKSVTQKQITAATKKLRAIIKKINKPKKK